MNILHGKKAFQSFLRSQRVQIGAAPILLVESKPLNEVVKKHVDDACCWARFVFQQQMGLPTVVYHSQYAFPTMSDLQQASEMAARVGAATVAAVGSGSAMDLAKCLALDDLILLPATPGAILAAGSSHALFYDLAEETLLPKERKHAGTVALVHAKSEHVHESLYACLAIALDNLFQECNDDSTLLRDAIRTIRESTKLHDNDTNDLLIRSGQSLRYGLDEKNRSIPLALLASLVTTELSAYSPMGVLASSVPPLLDVLKDKYFIEQQDKELFAAAPRAVTTSSVNSLVTRIRENQASTGCCDVSDKILRTVLQHHSIIS